MTDRATAYVRKVHCAVVSTASGSVQGETQSYLPGKNNATEAPSAECIWNTGYALQSVSHRVGHFRQIFDREAGIAH